MGGRTRRTDVEGMIATLASRQHGVVTRAQLIRAGVTAEVVDHRIKLQRLRRLHRGVYLAGPLPLPHTREMAAVLACGDSAVVSHRTAAVLWRLLPRRAGGDPMEVTVARGRAGNKPGIRVHRAGMLLRDEVTKQSGVPVTTPARTLYDLAGVLFHRDLERAVAEAFARRVTSRSRVLSLLDRYARRPGARTLRALVQPGSDPALTRSEAEERFLALVRKGRLRAPEVNVTAHGHEVDFYWRADRLVVEVDGRAFHSSARSFHRDRDRDGELVAAGLRVMRVTWHQIVDEPEALLVRLAQALAR